MQRILLLGTIALLSGCTSDSLGEQGIPASTIENVTNAIEASQVLEVAEIPTEQAALEQAEAEITLENADEQFQELLSEIEAESAEQP